MNAGCAGKTVRSLENACHTWAPKRCVHDEALYKSTFTFTFTFTFTTELVAKIISEIKVGRAADIDGLMGEHLVKAHPILPVILSKFFNLMVLSRHIPTAFGYSYIVPIPKGTVKLESIDR